jgi:hypothetical protein
VVFKEQNRYLEELKKKARKEEDIFRKTQVLKRETAKI